MPESRCRSTILSCHRLLLSAALCTSACTSTTSGVQPTVFAVHNQGTITTDAYEGWLEHRGEKEDGTTRLEFLTVLAIQDSLATEAVAAGLHEEPEARIALAMGEAGVLERELRITIDQSIKISADTLDREIDERQPTFTGVPRRVRLHNIFKRVPSGADTTERAAIRQALEKIRSELLAGADFADLVRRESDSQSRYKGGKMALIGPGELSAEVEAIAFGLEPGELSEIIETTAGFTILRCDGFAAARQPSPEKIRTEVLQTLRKQAFERRMGELRRRLLKELVVNVAALRPEGDGEQPALTLPPAYVLGAEEAWVSMASFGVRPGDTRFDDDDFEEILQEVAWRLAAAEEARRLGLQEQASVATKLTCLRRDTLTTAALKRRVMNQFETITEEAIQELYTSSSQSYMLEDQFRLQVLRREVGLEEIGEVYYRLEAVDRQVAAGEIDLAAAAAEHSDHRSAVKGGHLGWLYRQQVASLGANVLTTVLALNDGETSELVQQPAGITPDSTLWIVRRLDSRPARRMTLTEAHAKLENELGNRQLRRLQHDIFAEVGRQLQVRLSSGGE